MALRTFRFWTLFALACCLSPKSASAQIPEPNPVCVEAYCSPQSKHPNRKIDCNDDGLCSCMDICGGGQGASAGSSSRSSGGGGGGQLVTGAVVLAAKVIFAVGAPGHAAEALAKKRTTAADAKQQFQAQLAAQARLAQHGRDLAIEAEALRQFRDAVKRREENPQRYLRPLFDKTPAAPRMNVRDPLQQLRCVNQALQSAEAAVESAIPGDISFLDARRAVDIASGAWDSGLAPAGCAGESLASMAAASSAAQRQRLLTELVTGVETQVAIQLAVRETRAQAENVEKKASEARKNFTAEQERKLAPVRQANEQAQKDAAEAQQAVEEQRQAEPPPTVSRKHPDKPKSNLEQRLLRARAEAEAHVEEMREKLEQVTKDLATETENFEKSLTAQVNTAKARVSTAEQSLQAAREATSERLTQLGMPPNQPGR